MQPLKPVQKLIAYTSLLLVLLASLGGLFVMWMFFFQS